MLSLVGGRPKGVQLGDGNTLGQRHQPSRLPGQTIWVYIVEHLTDGQEPTVTAIFNPVRDDNLDQSPVGKMRVTGWRSAVRQQRGSFTRIVE